MNDLTAARLPATIATDSKNVMRVDPALLQAHTAARIDQKFRAALAFHYYCAIVVGGERQTPASAVGKVPWDAGRLSAETQSWCWRPALASGLTDK